MCFFVFAVAISAALLMDDGIAPEQGPSRPAQNPAGLLLLALTLFVICAALVYFRKPFPANYHAKKSDELPCALDRQKPYY
jgi:hypothetical protein